jgi:hypothetical protein
VGVMLLGEAKREAPVRTEPQPAPGELIQAKRCASAPSWPLGQYDAFLKKSATGQLSFAQLALASSFQQKVVD